MTFLRGQNTDTTKKSKIKDGTELWLCSICEAWLPALSFGPSKQTKNKLKSQCKKCCTTEENGKYHKMTSSEQKRKRLKKYGLTLEDYESMVANQHAKCAICKKVKPLCIDHDHQTRKIRGLLCHQCNTALGSFSDSIAVLRSAMHYLEVIVGSKLTVTEGDVLDRYSILVLRLEHGDENAHNEIVPYEIEAKLLMNDERIAKTYEKLYSANRSIWKLESDIRQNKIEKLSLSDIGKRAIEIREINRERIAAKNSINEIFGRYKDIKVDHVSQAKD